jgi:hypothetical protein
MPVADSSSLIPEGDLDFKFEFDDEDLKPSQKKVPRTRFQGFTKSAKDCWNAVSEVFQEGLQTDEDEDDGGKFWRSLISLIGAIWLCITVIAAVIALVMALYALAALFGGGNPSGTSTNSTNSTNSTIPDTDNYHEAPAEKIARLEREKVIMGKKLGSMEKELKECIEATNSGIITQLKSDLETMKTEHEKRIMDKDALIRNLQIDSDYFRDNYDFESFRLQVCNEEVWNLLSIETSMTADLVQSASNLEILKNKCFKLPDLSSWGVGAVLIVGNAAFNVLTSSVMQSSAQLSFTSKATHIQGG